MPLAGDLLRALRLRQQRKHADVAREIGVAQSTLAKWELTEDWPSVERLHALCFALHARDEELVALTTRVPAPGPPEASGPAEWEHCFRRIVHVVYNVQPSDLGDLVFYGLERELWSAAEPASPQEEWLASVFALHARWLAEFGRGREAAMMARNAVERMGSKAPERDDWLNAPIVLARACANQGRPRDAMRLLQPFLARAQSPAHQAWLSAEIAGFQAADGYPDNALLLSAHAALVARAQARPEEYWFRQLDHAEVLFRAGMPEQALERFPLGQEEPNTRNLPKHLLLGARINAKLGRAGDADHYLARAVELAEQYRITHLGDELSAVRAQIEQIHPRT